MRASTQWSTAISRRSPPVSTDASNDSPARADPAPQNYDGEIRHEATFTHDGVTLYYEVYGAGDPLLIVHFNGGSIADVGAQIDHFRKGYKVIAMDSRDTGGPAIAPTSSPTRR